MKYIYLTILALIALSTLSSICYLFINTSPLSSFTFIFHLFVGIFGLAIYHDKYSKKK